MGRLQQESRRSEDRVRSLVNLKLEEDMKRGPKTFPKKIYVVREKDPNSSDSYLLVSETLDPINEDGTAVGVYELKSKVKIKVTKTVLGK
jgi:hypothetical protein